MKQTNPRLLVLSLIGLIIPSLCFSQALPANVCTDATSNADIVVMLDITASQSASEISQEKAALLSFLNFFNAPRFVQKPHIAVGTFNHDCTNPGGVVVCNGDPARILPNSGLTNDYGTVGGAPDLADDVNGISGEGFLGNGKGATNIEAALRTAQAELDLNGSPDRPDYIVFVSDGDPNLPGFNAGTCNDCTCPVAEDAADNYTTSIEPDTQIIAIHFRGSLIACGDEAGEPAGLAFMRDRIASNPSLFNPGLNLATAFEAIADNLVCDDQDSCTTDVCNSRTAPVSCEYTPDTTDTDQDNVPDCLDICPNGDDSQIGLPCNVGVGQCLSTGILECGTTGIVCNAIAGDVGTEVCDGLDNDCDGDIDNGINCALDCAGVVGGLSTLDRCDVCQGDGSSCLDCNDQNITEQLFALDGNGLQQQMLVELALKRLKRRRPKARTFINETSTLANELYLQNWIQTWSTPTVIQTCGNQVFCTEVNVSSDVTSTYLANSDQLQALLNQTLRKLKRTLGRTRRMDRQLRKRMRALVAENATLVADLPETQSLCS